jgi:hypothetical protein
MLGSLLREQVFAIFVAVVGLPLAAAGTGWNDYEVDIAPGFTVVRANTFEVCLGTSDGRILVCPSHPPGELGPLVGYVVTSDQIVTRHFGARLDPENPLLGEQDPSKELFFFVSRRTLEVVGPLSRAEFDQSPLKPTGEPKWQAPHNPNFWRPLLGQLAFIGITLLIFGTPVVAVGAGIWVGWRLLRRRLRRKGA